MQRPNIERLKTYEEELSEDWLLLAPSEDHFAVDTSDGCVLTMNGDEGFFFLDEDEVEALVEMRNSFGELLNYVQYMEMKNARLERRLEQIEDIAMLKDAA